MPEPNDMGLVIYCALDQQRIEFDAKRHQVRNASECRSVSGGSLGVFQNTCASSARSLREPVRELLLLIVRFIRSEPDRHVAAFSVDCDLRYSILDAKQLLRPCVGKRRDFILFVAGAKKSETRMRRARRLLAR